MPENLYDQVIAGPFHALCGGGEDSDGTMEDCLTLAELAGGGYAVRDTKLGDNSPELRFTKAELIAAAHRLAALD
ncbi:DUF397 domain-containing protein [Streptomyces sp. JH002]|uniref:DUF397 domain-containing protein n=1 Tax=Streptomyces sp. JH002 TaxID=2763259 RepID=UPI003D8048C5